MHRRGSGEDVPGDLWRIDRIDRIAPLRDRAEAGATVLTGHRVATVDADTFISAFGVRPTTGLAAALEGPCTVIAVGDCVKPAKVGDAINAGFEAAFAL